MTDTPIQTVPQAFGRTTWRGIQFVHPAEWEPAILSGQKGPGRCVLVDRRSQRMEVHWRRLPRGPDLEATYEQLRLRYAEESAHRQAVAPGWFALVRRKRPRQVVHAGRYFAQAGTLVEVVFSWPDGRDEEVERTVLRSVALPAPGDPVLWEALGFRVLVPAAFALTRASHLVGRIQWRFRRSVRPAANLTLERLAMGRYWLKTALGDWLAGERPQGFRVARESLVDCSGHDGMEVLSRRGGLLAAVSGRGEQELSRAWSCGKEERVYRLAYRQRSGEPADWPAGLEVHCCRSVHVGPGTPHGRA